jgi:hypothetical protein
MRNLLFSRLLVLPILVLLSLAACSSGTNNTTTGPTPTATVETFQGSIDQNGSAVYSFNVANGGFTLAVAFSNLAPASVTALGVGVAAWDAPTSTCGLNLAQNDSSKSGSTAVSGTAAAGAYCVRVYDGGNIPAGVSAQYTVQVQHY